MTWDDLTEAEQAVCDHDIRLPAFGWEGVGQLSQLVYDRIVADAGLVSYETTFAAALGDFLARRKSTTGASS